MRMISLVRLHENHFIASTNSVNAMFSIGNAPFTDKTQENQCGLIVAPFFAITKSLFPKSVYVAFTGRTSIVIMQVCESICFLCCSCFKFICQ